jgi:hypothetical protein
MAEAPLREFGLVVLGLVEPDYQLNAELLEDGHVVIWREGSVFICHIQGS